MSNLYQGISSGQGILQIYYQGPLQTQFNDDVPIWRAASKGEYSWSGLQVNRPVKVRRNMGIGATSDGGNLPNIGRQTTVQAVIPAAYNYLRFGITGPMLKASRSASNSFVRDTAFELAEGYNDLRVDCNRQLSWNGDGTMAKVNTTVAGSSSLVIKGREDSEPALKFIDVGFVFDIYNGATLVQSSITVTAVSGTPSASTATLTLDQNVTATAGYALVRSGSYLQEMKGLLYQLDNGTSTIFSNLDRATYPSLQGNVVDLNGAQLNLNSLQQAQDAAELRGAAMIDAVWSDFSSRRMYQKLLSADKRYVNTVEGDGGFADKGKYYLSWNGVPWIADQSCPTRVFMLAAKHLEKYTLADMEFADETGPYIPSVDTDAVEGRVRFFAQLFNSQASGSASVEDYVSP